MKKEIGKWFMDIAKYIATAVLLTQIFGGLAESPYIIVYALISVIAIFTIGISILHGDDEDKKEENTTKEERKRKYDWSNRNFNTSEHNGHRMLAVLPLFRQKPDYL